MQTRHELGIEFDLQFSQTWSLHGQQTYQQRHQVSSQTPFYERLCQQLEAARARYRRAKVLSERRNPKSCLIRIQYEKTELFGQEVEIQKHHR